MCELTACRSWLPLTIACSSAAFSLATSPTTPSLRQGRRQVAQRLHEVGALPRHRQTRLVDDDPEARPRVGVECVEHVVELDRFAGPRDRDRRARLQRVVEVAGVQIDVLLTEQVHRADLGARARPDRGGAAVEIHLHDHLTLRLVQGDVLDDARLEPVDLHGEVRQQPGCVREARVDDVVLAATEPGDDQHERDAGDDHADPRECLRDRDRHGVPAFPSGSSAAVRPACVSPHCGWNHVWPALYPGGRISA